MKKSIALILSVVLVLTGCASPASGAGTESVDMASVESSAIDQATANVDEPVVEESNDNSEVVVASPDNLSFSGLDDEELLTYVQNKVYSDVVSGLNSDVYFVENVEAIYVSEEYI